MFKWLLLLLLAIIAYRLVRSAATGRRPGDGTRRTEKMFACAHCGLYLPESEAMLSDGAAFCNKEHREQWLRSR